MQKETRVVRITTKDKGHPYFSDVHAKIYDEVKVNACHGLWDKFVNNLHV